MCLSVYQRPNFKDGSGDQSRGSRRRRRCSVRRWPERCRGGGGVGLFEVTLPMDEDDADLRDQAAEEDDCAKTWSGLRISHCYDLIMSSSDASAPSPMEAPTSTAMMVLAQIFALDLHPQIVSRASRNAISLSQSSPPPPFALSIVIWVSVEK